MGNLYKVDQSLFYQENPLVKKNPFIGLEPENEALPTYGESKALLPWPIWDGHEDAVECYDFTWKTAFGNLRKPVVGTGFVTNFIDTAFNDYLFMWDSAFILMFGKYGSKVFNFQKTLDNFYSHQHRDGFICREICETQNGEQFTPHEPGSTGPNIMPWSEWEYYRSTGDVERLKKVFYPLLAYHKWLQLNRTWPDGSYWASGFSAGMDNQPRVQAGYSQWCSHGHMIWVDACIHQIMSGKILIETGKIIGRENETGWLTDEVALLTKIVNEKLWNDRDSYYYDLWRNGEHNHVKTIGAYWALLADIVPEGRLERLIAHLENPLEFNRPHRVPTLSADDPHYVAGGDYWLGSVWAPTNYMVLKGLEKNGYCDLAYEIACNTLENVVGVYKKTGTVWENYAPEYMGQGSHARNHFVGWTGLIPISVLFEYVFGIRAEPLDNRIIWRVNRLERHGVMRYPLKDGCVDILCEGRKSLSDRPVVSVKSAFPVTVEVQWDGKKETIRV